MGENCQGSRGATVSGRRTAMARVERTSRNDAIVASVEEAEDEDEDEDDEDEEAAPPLPCSCCARASRALSDSGVGGTGSVGTGGLSERPKPTLSMAMARTPLSASMGATSSQEAHDPAKPWNNTATGDESSPPGTFPVSRMWCRTPERCTNEDSKLNPLVQRLSSSSTLCRVRVVRSPIAANQRYRSKDIPRTSRS